MVVRFFSFYSVFYSNLFEALRQIIADQTFWILAVTFVQFIVVLVATCTTIMERRFLKKGYGGLSKAVNRLKYHLLGAWYWLGIPFMCLNYVAMFYALYTLEDSIARGSVISIIANGGAVFFACLMDANTERNP